MKLCLRLSFHFPLQVKLYKKQVDELEDNLAMLKEGNDVDEENSPMAKQLASLRVSLSNCLNYEVGLEI